MKKLEQRKKALNRILDILFDDLDEDIVNEIAVIHANRLEGAESLVQSIKEKYPNVSIHISYFGPVIGTHLGSGSLGIGWY